MQQYSVLLIAIITASCAGGSKHGAKPGKHQTTHNQKAEDQKLIERATALELGELSKDLNAREADLNKSGYHLSGTNAASFGPAVLFSPVERLMEQDGERFADDILALQKYVIAAEAYLRLEANGTFAEELKQKRDVARDLATFIEGRLTQGSGDLVLHMLMDGAGFGSDVLMVEKKVDGKIVKDALVIRDDSRNSEEMARGAVPANWDAEKIEGVRAGLKEYLDDTADLVKQNLLFDKRFAVRSSIGEALVAKRELVKTYLDNLDINVGKAAAASSLKILVAAGIDLTGSRIDASKFATGLVSNSFDLGLIKSSKQALAQLQEFQQRAHAYPSFARELAVAKALEDVLTIRINCYQMTASYELLMKQLGADGPMSYVEVIAAHRASPDTDKLRIKNLLAQIAKNSAALASKSTSSSSVQIKLSDRSEDFATASAAQFSKGFLAAYQDFADQTTLVWK